MQSTSHEVHRQPQTEDQERMNLFFELIALDAMVERLYEREPRAITEMMKRRLEAGGDILSLTTFDLARICAEIRDEYPGLPGPGAVEGPE